MCNVSHPEYFTYSRRMRMRCFYQCVVAPLRLAPRSSASLIQHSAPSPRSISLGHLARQAWRDSGTETLCPIS